MNRLRQLVLALLLGAAAAAAAHARIELVDDRGRTLVLAQPAQRIVSLAPHITETLFAAGAGASIVGTVSYADFPEAARAIPRVGDIRGLDLERLLALKPDLVIVWLNGNAQRQMDVLEAMSLPIYYDEPRRLDDVAGTLERFGVLAGTETAARTAAAAYRERLAALRARHAGRAPVSAFFQVWRQPLLTINRRHLISDVIALCGGRNVFADEPMLVPQPSLEAVIEADPEAMLTTGRPGELREHFGTWLDWPLLTAVARSNLVLLPPEHISQHTPRILDGVQTICAAFDQARARRPRRASGSQIFTPPPRPLHGARRRWRPWAGARNRRS